MLSKRLGVLAVVGVVSILGVPAETVKAGPSCKAYFDWERSGSGSGPSWGHTGNPNEFPDNWYNDDGEWTVPWVENDRLLSEHTHNGFIFEQWLLTHHPTSC